MKQAGVEAIQPGIESFSDFILTLMGKGITGLQNIQLLKWCREIGVWPYWNILIGFPGEPKIEYDRMVQIVSLIMHLNSPNGFTQVQLSRYSPYFFDSQKYGLVNVRPLKIYEFIYPFNQEILQKIVYYFDYDYSDNRDLDQYTMNLRQKL
jgi:radical SAM superfamily enzyme YgiQ (UPF0313 family)